MLTPNAIPCARFRVPSAVLCGVKAIPVLVTAEHTDGLPTFIFSGVSEASAREIRMRVRAALATLGISLDGRWAITVTGAGACPPGGTAGLDLPIALAILGCLGHIPVGYEPSDDLRLLAYAELSLSGELREGRGSLVVADYAADHRFDTILAHGVRAYHGAGARTLQDVLAGVGAWLPLQEPALSTRERPDFSDVRGVPLETLQAIATAARAGRSILLLGPPGSGKTMIARRIPDLLPPMSPGEDRAVQHYADAAGLHPVPGHRPFRAPHHTTTPAGLVGGGSGGPHPGEVTLATHGVLFLDEATEFNRAALEALKQAIRQGSVTLARAAGTVDLPAVPALVVAAANLCVCGFAAGHSWRCSCTERTKASRSARMAMVRDVLGDPLVVHLPALTDASIKAEPVTGTADLRRETKNDLTRSLARIAEHMTAPGPLQHFVQESTAPTATPGSLLRELVVGVPSEKAGGERSEIMTTTLPVTTSTAHLRAYLDRAAESVAASWIDAAQDGPLTPSECDDRAAIDDVADELDMSVRALFELLDILGLDAWELRDQISTVMKSECDGRRAREMTTSALAGRVIRMLGRAWLTTGALADSLACEDTSVLCDALRWLELSGLVERKYLGQHGEYRWRSANPDVDVPTGKLEGGRDVVNAAEKEIADLKNKLTPYLQIEEQLREEGVIKEHLEEVIHAFSNLRDVVRSYRVISCDCPLTYMGSAGDDPADHDEDCPVFEEG